ncbi:electron transport complex subunit RsxG [Cohaesibacter intestini]|uniref:electron transport complex subunit RsxG n=1 Tax=Cohaesibacter intestini TaxID=2211145 RepID=UPI000DE9FAC0|nr:electron transport complex subunit RsxG [Cohaesibacter intestini]
MSGEADINRAPATSLAERTHKLGIWIGTRFEAIRSNPLYLALLLGFFSVVSALTLSSAFLATEEAIDLRHKEDLQKSLALVIPDDRHDNDLVTSAFTLKSEDGIEKLVYPARLGGQLEAVAYQTTALGYGGPILVLLGVDKDGQLLGVRVLQHAETPGLGDKIEADRSDWITRFAGLSLGNLLPEKWAVKKDGGAFDQFSGATITPRAVVRSVKQGLQFFEQNKAKLLAQPSDNGKG